jgi:hypothetical protein
VDDTGAAAAVTLHEVYDGQAGGVPGSPWVSAVRPVHRRRIIDGEDNVEIGDPLTDDSTRRASQAGQPDRPELLVTWPDCCRL